MIRLFNRYYSIPSVACLVVEAAILFGSLILAFWIRTGEYFGGFTTGELVLRGAVFSVTVLVTFYLGGLYDFASQPTLRELRIRMWRAFLFSIVALWAVYYVLPGLFTGRGVFAIAWGVSLVALSLWRILFRSLLARNQYERVLIVGADQDAQMLAREILDRKHLGYRVVGFLDDDPTLQGKSLVNPRVIGTTNDARALAIEQRATRLVVARRDFRGWLNMDALLDCKTSGIPVERGPDYYERLTGKLALHGLRKSWLVFSKGFVVSRTVQLWKRMLDLATATMGLILAAPVMVLVVLAIRLESRGSVLYRQERVGLNGRIFTLLKFRSMQQDAESDGTAIWAQTKDSRVTRVGRVLRKSRIDELPQLWNVLFGHMSLVGPRPERPEFVKQLVEMNPLYAERHVVRPGLTGWAQINAAYAASFEDSIQKLQYDLYYIKNISLLLDISIILSTIRTVILGRGAR